MSATTHPITLEPIDAAPHDGRAFEAPIDQHVCLVRWLLGRWQWKVETFDKRINAPKIAWQNMPEDKQPTHWIKGSVGRHGPSKEPTK